MKFENSLHPTNSKGFSSSYFLSNLFPRDKLILSKIFLSHGLSSFYFVRSSSSLFSIFVDASLVGCGFYLSASVAKYLNLCLKALKPIDRNKNNTQVSLLHEFAMITMSKNRLQPKLTGIHESTT